MPVLPIWLRLACVLVLAAPGLAFRPSAGPGHPPLPPALVLGAPVPLPAPAFGVAAVVDARPAAQAVAWLLPPPAGAGRPAPAARALDLAGGAAATLTRFLTLSAPPQAARRPVRVRVLECRITEAPGPAGQVLGRVEVTLGFDALAGEAPVPLTDYRGVARYGRPAGAAAAAVAEPILRQQLTRGLHYLAGWLQQAAGHDPRLAPGVRLAFADFRRAADPDTLFYDPARPLTRADFRGTPRPGRFAAAVFPSFSFSARPTFGPDGWVHLLIETRVFVVRSSSWMSAVADEAYTLNHEQRHFDLVRGVAARFRQKIRAAALTPTDFNAAIQLAYFTSYQEMNRLQEQYDAETRHGNDPAAQQRWNQRLDAELRQAAQAE